MAAGDTFRFRLPPGGSHGIGALGVFGLPAAGQSGPVSDASRSETSREMAKDLELHLGAVSRDVSNMQDAGLLNIEFYNGRRRYIVNEQSLQILARHILDLCQESGEQT